MPDVKFYSKPREREATRCWSTENQKYHMVKIFFPIGT